jgi:hypothetical protein
VCQSKISHYTLNAANTDLVYDGDFKVLAWLPFPSDLPAPLLKAWCVTAKALPDISAISALIAVKHGNYSSLTPLSARYAPVIDMAMNGVGCRASARIMGVGLNTVYVT